jgi:hypothetical protein
VSSTILPKLSLLLSRMVLKRSEPTRIHKSLSIPLVVVLALSLMSTVLL